MSASKEAPESYSYSKTITRNYNVKNNIPIGIEELHETDTRTGFDTKSTTKFIGKEALRSTETKNVATGEVTKMVHKGTVDIDTRDRIANELKVAVPRRIFDHAFNIDPFDIDMDLEDPFRFSIPDIGPVEPLRIKERGNPVSNCDKEIEDKFEKAWEKQAKELKLLSGDHHHKHHLLH